MWRRHYSEVPGSDSLPTAAPATFSLIPTQTSALFAAFKAQPAQRLQHPGSENQTAKFWAAAIGAKKEKNIYMLI